jgi:hypothetical protein
MQITEVHQPKIISTKATDAYTIEDNNPRCTAVFWFKLHDTICRADKPIVVK